MVAHSLRTYLRGSSGAYIGGAYSYRVLKTYFLISTDTMLTTSMSCWQGNEHFHLILGVGPYIAMSHGNDPVASQNEQNEQNLGKFSFRWYIQEGAVKRSII